jgi:hypothetical protein
VTVLALLVAGLTLATPPPGVATVRMQERAQALGYPADECAYCHSFTREHMTRHAREAGLESTNCIHCHGDELPLDGVDLYNERGRFLLEVKKARKAQRTDMAWLADYVEKDPGENQRKPGKKPKPDRDGSSDPR